MTRKHFTKLAEHFNASMPSLRDNPDAHRQWVADILTIADALADFNPAFDHERFHQACGYRVQTLEEQHAAATGLIVEVFASTAPPTTSGK